MIPEGAPPLTSTTDGGKSAGSLVLPIVFLTAFGLLFIYGMLFLYAYPSADDFCYASEPRLKGFWFFQQEFYRHWSGRYMATLVLSSLGMLPLERIYSFCSLLVFAGTLAGFAAMAAVLAGTTLKKPGVWGLAVVAFMVYLGNLPSVVEAFYWMAGAYTYQAAIALVSVWSALVIAALRTDAVPLKTRPAWFILPLIVLGLNEMTAILFLAVIGWFLMVSYSNRPEMHRQLRLVAILSVLCIAVLLCAPGNAIRSSSYPALPSRHLLTFAVPETAWQTFRFVKQYALYPALWLGAIAVWLWGKKRLRPSFPAWTNHPALWVFLALALVFITLFPVYWEYGSNNLTGEGRTYNVTYFCFLTMMTVAIVAGLEKYVPHSVYIWLESRFVTHLVLSLALALSLVVSPNTITAWQSLQAAPAYLQEQLQREQSLRAIPPGASITVARIRNKPKFLFWGDIEAEPTHWINKCVSDYYRLKSVQSVQK